MKKYIIPFAAYLLTFPIINFLVHDIYIAYSAKAILTGILLAYFYKQYKEIKYEFDIIAIMVGLAIFAIWIFLEGFYPLLGTSEFNPYLSTFPVIAITFRFAGSIIIAPLIEELFTRSFLIRFITAKKWKKVKIGTYTLGSFIITVLFFGLAHNRWLPGIITGIILNILLYKRKNIFSCIQAHASANLALSIYILKTASWGFW